MNFDNPMIQGALAPTTVALLASAGESLANTIEQQNQKFDAQMKAPLIGKTYADSLTKIAQGNFEGFKGIAAATAATAGNPILASLFKDFDTAGVRLADSFMDRQAQTGRFDQAEKLQGQRIAASEVAATERATVSENAATARNTFSEKQADKRYLMQIEREDNQLHLDKIRDWERDKAIIDKQYEAQVKLINEQNAGERRAKELDPNHELIIQPVPPKPEYPPQPKRELRTPLPSQSADAGVQMTGDLFDNSEFSSSVPMPRSTSSANRHGVVNQSHYAGQGEGDGDFKELPPVPPIAEGQPPAEQTLVNETQMPPGVQGPPEMQGPTIPPEIAAKAEERNQEPPKDGKVERQVGNAVFEIHGVKPGARKVDVSETANTATGSITVKRDGEIPAANRLSDALVIINANDPELAAWMASKIESNKKVFLYTQQGDKQFNSETMAYSIEDGKNVPFRAVSDKETIEAFKTARQLMLGEMKGRFGITFEIPNPDAMREDLLKKVAGNFVSEEKANSQLKKYRVKPFEKEEIGIAKQKLREESIRKNKVPTDAGPFDDVINQRDYNPILGSTFD